MEIDITTIIIIINITLITSNYANNKYYSSSPCIKIDITTILIIINVTLIINNYAIL